METAGMGASFCDEPPNTPSQDAAFWRKLHGSSRKSRRSGNFWSFPFFAESANAQSKISLPAHVTPVAPRDSAISLITKSHINTNAVKNTRNDVKESGVHVNRFITDAEHLCQDQSSPKATLIAKSRHVQIVIPPFAPTSTQTATIVTRIVALENKEVLGTTTKALATVVMTTSNRDENYLKAAPSSIGQSFPYLRDFNSINSSQRNASQSSLAQSDRTLSDQELSNSRFHIYPQSNITTAGLQAPHGRASSNIAGLMCNVHRTTGKEPPALIGAATVISGDKLYVFGGRRLSRRRPQMTGHLYELNLIQRHWTLIETRGTPPPPRYFHSLNTLGDLKLVCYGGMTVAPAPKTEESGQTSSQQADPAMVDPTITVLGDLHIYDIPSRTWSQVQAANIPEGRYAHCATILPSSSVLASTFNPEAPSQNGFPSGVIQTTPMPILRDGRGGAELIIVGGQDSASRYIEQINVFNLRSLSWSTIDKLSGNYGAYRTVVAPLIGISASEIGSQLDGHAARNSSHHTTNEGTATIIYSNYNFLDVKLELKIRLPDGRVVEKPMPTGFSPPGLRFPNGGVINNHFVVSGTYLTSSRQEYAFWALNLKTLNWHRVETGSNYLLSGSWNRGLLWSRRNAYVILGDRRRSLADDYNQRRTNFSHMCTVELEAFGLYDNPRTTGSASDYVSASCSTRVGSQDIVDGGRRYPSAAGGIGRLVLGLKEFSDMDFLAIGGERIPANSHVIANRWGPFFQELQRESPTQLRTGDALANSHPPQSDNPFRNSLHPTISASSSTGSTLVNDVDIEATPRPPQRASMSTLNSMSSPPYAKSQNSPKYKPQRRVLYLPHTQITIQALVHYFYTSALAPLTSPLSTPQVLCSLLQIARPYRIDGLLEAVVERLHQTMDANNTAAIFNAAAMAAGGGDAIRFTSNAATPPTTVASQRQLEHPLALRMGPPKPDIPEQASDTETSETEQDSAWEDETSTSGASSPGSEASGQRNTYIWRAKPSAVIGLQKRGLRGLMEGRRLRSERMRQFVEASEQPRSALRSPTELADSTDGGPIGLGIV